jgi:hypothetical protein
MSDIIQELLDLASHNDQHKELLLKAAEELKGTQDDPPKPEFPIKYDGKWWALAEDTPRQPTEQDSWTGTAFPGVCTGAFTWMYYHNGRRWIVRPAKTVTLVETGEVRKVEKGEWFTNASGHISQWPLEGKSDFTYPIYKRID